MNTIFAINFRREAYLQEVSRRRRRVVALGVWVAYFGVLLVLVGLYALNGRSLAHRVALLERQTAVLRHGGAALGVQITPGDLGQVEAIARSTRQWRDRLERLPRLLPPEARLTTIQVNPQNLSDPDARSSLVIAGETRTTGKDRMSGVMAVVAAIRQDSVFARSYHNVRLASTRINEDGSAAFQVECK